MIHKLILRNFKSISEQSYEFTDFDLLVGRNNSGKSTILQALAIWQFCVDGFSREQGKARGSKGIQRNPKESKSSCRASRRYQFLNSDCFGKTRLLDLDVQPKKDRKN